MTRQIGRNELRRIAFKTITDEVGGKRSLRRLLARSLGNRRYRQANNLPEPKNTERRGGLRK